MKREHLMKSTLRRWSGSFAALALVATLFSSCAKRIGSLTPLPGGSQSGERSMDGGVRAQAQLLRAADEVWVIARGHDASTQPPEDSPGAGTLFTTMGEKQMPMPLKHTDVKAWINGYIGQVRVRQQFENPYSTKIEAVYVFPLPHDAAVNEFILTIGDRRIRGIIRERKEAERIYAEAKSQGYVASLLTEERPNVFTQSVANIEPGKAIDVEITYLHTLQYTDGWYEFIFPMVVGPRFNPAGTTNGIGAVLHGEAGASGQAVEVQYLAAGEKSGHNISLEVDLNGGVSVEQVECKTHKATQKRLSPEHLRITLDSSDDIPNRDFVLRYRVGGENIKSSLLAQRTGNTGYFNLMLLPPADLQSLQRQPIELVFVIDCSGSMDGAPITQAKAAVQRGLRLLQRGDSFQLISFSMKDSRLGPRPLEANSINIRRGLDYLKALDSEGGTMMIEGIKAALDFPQDANRLRFVCFLTDGYIGNEAEIIREIRQHLGRSRIFSFGIGSSVNRFLIEQMARTGRGAAAFLGGKDDAAEIMEDFFERISHPALTDLRVAWNGATVSEVFPRQLPDLFVGRPVILNGKFTGALPASVRLIGNAGGRDMVFDVPVVEDSTATPQTLATIWARHKISELDELSFLEPDVAWNSQIRQVALDYGLMSYYTAFNAVDSSTVTAGSAATTVPVAVPVPERVNPAKTVKPAEQQ
jgi:Ca-activated chloride channel family protein